LRDIDRNIQDGSMYVCICKGIREGDIRNLASTEPEIRMRDLRLRLGVCSECGKCGQRALGLLRDRRENAVNLDLQLQA
jgi:bacterioferritin-associated ferredoxin